MARLTRPTYRRLLAARELLHARYREPMPLGELAAAVGRGGSMRS